MSSVRLLSRLAKQPSVAENTGSFVPGKFLRGGDAGSARMARLLWRALRLSHDNGRYSGVSIWWTNGSLRSRAIYVDIFTGKYVSKDFS